MKRIKRFALLPAAALCLGLAVPVSAAEPDDASLWAGKIDYANIDASIYLDYSAGIEAGVYQWILSDDGSYYTLAAVNEEGEADTAAEAEINVGANNEESIDNGGSASGEFRRGSGELGGFRIRGRVHERQHHQ